MEEIMSTFTMVLTKEERKEIEEAKEDGITRKAIILMSLKLRKKLKEELKNPNRRLSITENGEIIKELVLLI